MRLLFLLGLLSLALPRPALADGTPAWGYTRNVSVLGDVLSANAALPGSGRHTLWLGCARDQEGAPFISAAVTGDRLLGAGSLSERVTLIRFDEAMPDVSRWSYRDRAGVLSSKEFASRFTDQLMGASRLAIDLSDYRLSVSQAVFHLDKAETIKIVRKLKADCARAAGGPGIARMELR